MTLGELVGTIPLGGLMARYYYVRSIPLDDHGHRGDGDHGGVGQGGRKEDKKRRRLTVAFSVTDSLTPYLNLLSSINFALRGWSLPTRGSRSNMAVATAGQRQ